MRARTLSLVRFIIIQILYLDGCMHPPDIGEKKVPLKKDKRKLCGQLGEEEKNYSREREGEEQALPLN